MEAMLGISLYTYPYHNKNISFLGSHLTLLPTGIILISKDSLSKIGSNCYVFFF
jgi:hypothetical protein